MCFDSHLDKTRGPKHSTNLLAVEFAGPDIRSIGLEAVQLIKTLNKFLHRKTRASEERDHLGELGETALCLVEKLDPVTRSPLYRRCIPTEIEPRVVYMPNMGHQLKGPLRAGKLIWHFILSFSFRISASMSLCVFLHTLRGTGLSRWF